MSQSSVILGKSRNVNTAPVVLAGVAVNNSTSTTLVILTKFDSLMVMTNDGNQDVWVKLQAASVDDDKKGFIVYKGTTTELDLEKINYPGEVSAITANGNSTMYLTVL